MTATFRLSDGVVCRKTNTELRMLFDRRKGVMYELNETASAIVEQLEGKPRTVDELITVLLDDFDAAGEEIREDVTTFLAEFSEANVIVEEVSDGATYGA
jgi:Coenzyme PQQ synthesis protein D (PqqD)